MALKKKCKRPFLQCSNAGITEARQRVQASTELSRAYKLMADELVQDNRVPSGSRASTFATVWVALADDSYATTAVKITGK